MGVSMAGIGFELKKMFSKKGVFPLIKAYGYAATVCVGPMLLGMCFLIVIGAMSILFGTSEHERELLNSMVTYTLLSSMVLTGILSMVLTRFVADSLYSGNTGAVLPSFWGGVSIMLAAGEPAYGIFLACAGIPALYAVLCLILFGELVLVWTQMSYLTAVKDYQGIIKIFACSLVLGCIVGAGLIPGTRINVVTAMLASVTTAYGVMAVLYYRLMTQYFSEGNISSMCFVSWVRKYPQLVMLGLFMSLGLFGHLVIMWSGQAGRQIQGLFYAAPVYDIPAIAAFLSILITTINFVTSVEVNFYPKYRAFFDALNNGGILKDIRQAGDEMKSVLFRELTYTFMKQLFTTLIFIIAGSIILPKLPLGVDDDMLGIYRVLCMGYAFYAVGNCLMLIELYFADNTGALISGTVFMAVSCAGTFFFRNMDIKYYGIGFWAGSVLFSLTAFIILRTYLKNLMYNVLCSKPLYEKRKLGIAALIAAIACISVSVSACSANKGIAQGEQTQSAAADVGVPGDIQKNTEVSKRIKDKAVLYENQDNTSVVTMYLTVTTGNKSDNTEHTWTQINSYSVYDYEEMGVERYAVNGLLQVGDEKGPVEGELGYGQNVPNATVTIRGQSSSRNAQKNYKITIRDDKGMWNDQKVINLNKHMSDFPRFSNKLCYDLQSGLPDLISLRTQFVHLYVRDMTEGGNGVFEDYGLYTQVEQLNKRALKSHGLDRNGQLYKINFFEFYRYEDVIMPKNDADYNVEEFEQYLEIKGSDDHNKLIAMLEDLNDYSIPISEVLDKWFEENNLFSWMAFNILMGNVDTQSRNVFLYSPLNENTWYFISWDNDGAFTASKSILHGDERGWEKGVSNYWGNILFRRILMDETLREKLDGKINEFKAVITEEKLKNMIKSYSTIVKQYTQTYPDLRYMPLTGEEYEEFLEVMVHEVEMNYELYKESLNTPMPFYISTPVVKDGMMKFGWETAYDFDAEDVYYTLEVARDYSFTEPVIKAEKLFVVEYDYNGVLEPGQYFMRVKAENESGYEQTAFDYYSSGDSRRIYGVKCFFVLEDGSIWEDIYEQ